MATDEELKQARADEKRTGAAVAKAQKAKTAAIEKVQELKSKVKSLTPAWDDARVTLRTLERETRGAQPPEQQVGPGKDPLGVAASDGEG